MPTEFVLGFKLALCSTFLAGDRFGRPIFHSPRLPKLPAGIAKMLFEFAEKLTGRGKVEVSRGSVAESANRAQSETTPEAGP